MQLVKKVLKPSSPIHSPYWLLGRSLMNPIRGNWQKSIKWQIRILSLKYWSSSSKCPCWFRFSLLLENKNGASLVFGLLFCISFPLTLLAFSPFLTYATFPGFSRNCWRQRSRWLSRFSGMLLLSILWLYHVEDRNFQKRGSQAGTHHLKHVAWETQLSWLWTKRLSHQWTGFPSELRHWAEPKHCWDIIITLYQSA